MTLLKDKVTGAPLPTGGVLALGNFDGVHLGHKAVLAEARKMGHKAGLPVYAMTFEPHPYGVLHKVETPFLLTSPTEKRQRMREAGADGVITLAFTRDLAALSPEAFVDEILVGQCAVKKIVVGFDFVFGHGRGGGFDLLRNRLEPLGIEVMKVEPVRDERGEIISSSRIRAALRQGDALLAGKLLGRPFMIQGRIQKGQQRGRALEVPTANIILEDVVRPRYGVYAVRAHAAGEEVWWPGVANFGVRPTFGGNDEVFEFHLFDFYGEIYETDWEVALMHFLRPEKAFSSPSLLKEQMLADVAQARVLLGAGAEKAGMIEDGP